MPDWAKELIPHVVAGAIVAALTVWLTVKFALWRFYREKHWERKAQAYESILDALHHIKQYFEAEYDDQFRDGKNQAIEERKEALGQRLRQAHAELSRQKDIASLFISLKAIERLSDYEKATDRATQTTSWFEHLEISFAAVRSCLADMLEIARHDLNLKG